MRVIQFILSILIFVSFNSCGPISSGTWEDDDENWDRAYGYDLHKEIKLVHSWYWRSPHFTMEQELFFEIEYDEGVKESFLKYGGLKRVRVTAGTSFAFFHKKPSWFIPKSYESYYIWESSMDNFKMFIDKETKHIFWADYQV